LNADYLCNFTYIEFLIKLCQDIMCSSLLRQNVVAYTSFQRYIVMAQC